MSFQVFSFVVTKQIASLSEQKGTVSQHEIPKSLEDTEYSQSIHFFVFNQILNTKKEKNGSNNKSF